MESGVALVVATRDEANVPAIARAGGCRVDDDGRVAVFLAPEQSQRCLDNAAANGHVALLCVVPHGYECYQIKGEAARVAPLERGDAARIAAYRAAFFASLRITGIEPAAAAGLLPADAAAFVTLSFVVTDVFHNTPGPAVGTAPKGGAR